MTEAADALVEGPPRPSAYRELWANRNYRLWFAASFTSSLGDWMGFVALPILVASLFAAGSRPALFALGGVMMARLLPGLLMGPLAGVFADRYDRRRLIVFTYISRAGLFVALAFSRDVTAVFALTFVVECLALLFMASKDALLPAVVDRRHLTQANQLNLLVTYGTLPLGAVAASGLIALAGLLRGAGLVTVDPVRLALIVDAGTFLASAAMMARLNVGRGPGRVSRQEGPGVLAELREGIAFIRGRPLIRALIFGVVGVFFGAGVLVALGPEFVRASLGRPEGDWTILMSAVGIGLMAGILLVPLANRWIRKERLFPLCLAAAGGIAIVIALLPTFMLTLLFGVLLGVAAGLSFVQGYTLLHEHTHDETRARTFAAFYTTTRMAMFTAFAFGPFLAGTIGTASVSAASQVVVTSGIRLTILLGGAVGLFSGLSVRRRIKEALRTEAGRPVRLPPAATDRGGMFVVFEGVEGSGKSTQVRKLAEALEAEGRDVVVTREPGGSTVAERIRSILLDPNAAGMESRTEALLYAAARAEHVDKVIRPALEAGKIVVCDRFVDSSLAYQGHARGLGEEDVFEINRWAVNGVLPDAVVLLRLDPEEGLRRVAERSRRRARADAERGARLVDALQSRLPEWTEQLAADRLEREGIDFHRRVAAGYLDLARRQRSRFIVVEATGDAGTIARQVRAALHAWLPLPQQEHDDTAVVDRPEAAG